MANKRVSLTFDYVQNYLSAYFIRRVPLRSAPTFEMVGQILTGFSSNHSSFYNSERILKISQHLIKLQSTERWHFDCTQNYLPQLQLCIRVSLVWVTARFPLRIATCSTLAVRTVLAIAPVASAVFNFVFLLVWPHQVYYQVNKLPGVHLIGTSD